MKKSIVLLFLLLIGCVPVATVPPTFIALPPSPTLTPSPTANPEPTATPSAPREAEAGIVQVFENGKWVDMNSKIPDTIWGEKPEEASVVLKDGEAVLQMELNNFQTEDGSNTIKAKYNRDTNSWQFDSDLVLLRATPLIDPEIYPKNYHFDKHSDHEARVDLFVSQGTILGVKDISGDTPQFLVLYKNNLVWVTPEVVMESVVVSGNRQNRIFDEDNASFSPALEIIYLIDRNIFMPEGRVSAQLNFLKLQEGATTETCSQPLFASKIELGEEFEAWCEGQIASGISHASLNKDNLDWIFNGSGSPFLGEESLDLETLKDNLASVGTLAPIDGTFFALALVE